MWDKAKLTALATRRRDALTAAETAFLAYARTQEMTEERLDVTQARQDLATALDQLEPEDVDKLRALGDVHREDMLRDFLLTVFDHTQQRLDRELEQTRSLLQERAPEEPVPTRKKPTRKR
jgi:hypothetical protein